MADLTDLLEDEDWREALSKQAYYRERAEQAAAASEHDVEAAEYLTLDWDALSDDARRPYRTAVAESCDSIAEIALAV